MKEFVYSCEQIMNEKELPVLTYTEMQNVLIALGFFSTNQKQNGIDSQRIWLQLSGRQYDFVLVSEKTVPDIRGTPRVSSDGER